MADNETATTTTQETTETVDTAELQAEIDRLKGENAKLKNAQSNASADASKYKKALQERMSEQERAATEAKELMDQLKAENAELKRSQTLAEHRAGYIGLGFDEATAEKAAAATYDGDFTNLMAAFKEFVAAHDKALLADAVRNTPRPGAGSADAQTVTREQLDKMNYSQRVKLFAEQPELYKTLMKKEE